ncbi:SGNH hydrolase [Actinokineospora globicatena]|nr:SGNH hydrolase [Actinokineospora globicatena]GLW86306.1 SGNH hydrolase [Actinokineospora globicatena]
MMSTFHFAVLGDSLAAGVGCSHPSQTLGHRLAAVVRGTGRQVALNVRAVSRARSADLAAQVPAGPVDLALIVVGANDLTSFTPPQVGARLLGQIVASLVHKGARVVVATAPDLSIVSGVPPAYRDFVRQASALYAQAQADAVRAAGGIVADIDPALFDRFRADPSLFSADRFHPSPAGYALIAEALAPSVSAPLRTERL